MGNGKYDITCLDRARVMVTVLAQGRANALGCGEWPEGRSIKISSRWTLLIQTPSTRLCERGSSRGPIECLGKVSSLDLLPPLPSACFLRCETLFQVSPAQPGTGGSPLHLITSKPVFLTQSLSRCGTLSFISSETFLILKCCFSYYLQFHFLLFLLESSQNRNYVQRT